MQKLLHHLRWSVPAEILLCEVPIPIENSKRHSDNGVLGVDGRENEGRVRRDEHGKRVSACPPHGLLDIHRANTGWKVRLPFVRQPRVRKPKPFFCGDKRGKHGGHGLQGPCCLAREEDASGDSGKDFGSQKVVWVEAVARADRRVRRWAKEKDGRPGMEEGRVRQDARTVESKLWENNDGRTQSNASSVRRENWANTYRRDKEKDEGGRAEAYCSRRANAVRNQKVGARPVRGLTLRRQREYAECMGKGA